jgi:hypothetical protein
MLLKKGDDLSPVLFNFTLQYANKNDRNWTEYYEEKHISSGTWEAGVWSRNKHREN